MLIFLSRIVKVAEWKVENLGTDNKRISGLIFHKVLQFLLYLYDLLNIDNRYSD